MFFAIAAGTDWVDGFWARRYGQITQLGRILDPFADKIIICGTFMFLAAVPPTFDRRIDSSHRKSGPGWPCIVVARELLVTALRSFFEEHGTDFSAKWSGKWKMVLQCAAVAASLWRLWYYGYRFGMLVGRCSRRLGSTWSLRLTRLDRRRHDDLFRLGLRPAGACDAAEVKPIARHRSVSTSVNRRHMIAHARPCRDARRTRIQC